MLKWSGQSGQQSKEEDWRRSKEIGSRNLMDNKTQAGIVNERRSLSPCEKKEWTAEKWSSGREPRVNRLC